MGAEGKAIADKDRKEHKEAKEMLFKLQNMNAGYVSLALISLPYPTRESMDEY